MTPPDPDPDAADPADPSGPGHPSGPDATMAARVWDDLPAAVRRVVEGRLGGAVLGFEGRLGGFSDGVRGVVTTEAGERAFVKVTRVGAADEADFRAEARVAAALPPGVPSPRLLFACEEAGRLVLGSEVAPGRVPHEPWHEEELAAALAALTSCARELTPSPLTGLPTVAERMAGRCEIWNDLDPSRAGRWERAHLPRLAELERRWTDLVTGGTLLHFDPRFDNFLIDPYGTARLVDWGRACTGPAWADLVCLLLQSDLGPRDAEPVFAAHPLGRDARPDRVDALLVALLGYWTRTAAEPGPPHAPHLRDRRERSRRATLAWLRARWQVTRRRGCPAAAPDPAPPYG